MAGVVRVYIELLPALSLQVTPDYWAYARWRASHRLFSSVMGIFATQSLLAAVGVGAQRSLPAAAAINWVLKDGLGRLGRLGVATRFGQSFDADLKVRLRRWTGRGACVLMPLLQSAYSAAFSLVKTGSDPNMAWHWGAVMKCHLPEAAWDFSGTVLTGLSYWHLHWQLDWRGSGRSVLTGTHQLAPD